MSDSAVETEKPSTAEAVEEELPPPPPLPELGGTADDAFSDEEGRREESKGEGEEDEGPPRKKISLFMGYVGAGYLGFQRSTNQVGHTSIEAELVGALHRIGALEDADVETLSRAHWNRAARTDKGVSASGNVVSVNVLETSLEGEVSFVDRMNKELPAVIRIYGMLPATPMFNARTMADRRRYEYLVPLWALDPQMGKSRWQKEQEAVAAAAAAPVTSTEGEASAAVAASKTPEDPKGDTSAGVAASRPLEEPNMSSSDRAKARTLAEVSGSTYKMNMSSSDRAKARTLAEISGSTYEMSEGERRKLNLVLGMFVGRHNFHNFTSDVYIEAGTVDVDGKRFVKVVFNGESFMMYQIRKMMGLIIAIVRKIAPVECIRAALDSDRDFHVPMVPAAGLLMDEAYYEEYCRRFGDTHGKLGLEFFRDQANDFKKTSLYPHVATADHLEVWNFLTGCTNAQFEFTNWASAPKIRTVRMAPPPWLSGKRKQPEEDASGGGRGGRGGRGGKCKQPEEDASGEGRGGRGGKHNKWKQPEEYASGGGRGGRGGGEASTASTASANRLRSMQVVEASKANNAEGREEGRGHVTLCVIGQM
eukprot:gene10627-12303_t